MSTIVAIRNASLAVMAGDFQSCQGDTIVPGHMRVGPGKIHRVGDSYLGIVGSMAHHNVLCSIARSRPEIFKFDCYEDVFETLRSLHPILRDEYLLLTHEENEQEYESSQISGLIASKGGIFSFFGYREVTEYKTFWAAGSGMEYALGALQATQDDTATSIRDRAINAVVAASVFDSASGPPIESFELALLSCEDGRKAENPA